MTEPTPLFAPTQPISETDVGPSFIEMARAIASIAATRMLLLITVLTGSAIWVWAVADPSRDRLYAAIAFSIVFAIPQVVLYWRKG